MEKEKINLGNAAAGAGKLAASFFSKAKDAVVNTVDQNGDGKLGLDDVSAVTDTVKAALKESSDRWSEKQEQRRREKELETLRPLFESDVDKPDFSLPKLIRIAKMDDKHAQSEVCKNSIGYTFPGKDMDVLTIYPGHIEYFNLRFHQELGDGLYYVDPADRDYYIALNDYYNYLKIQRISELQTIARDLGAKSFSVIYKEYQKSASELNVQGKANLKAGKKQGATIDAAHHSRENSFSKIEVAAKMEFIGHEAQRPTLKYFKKDPQIQTLVDLRMGDNTLKHQVYTLELSNSSGIKYEDAVKIDSAIKEMNASSKISVASEALNEARRIFEYEIDF